ncbi:MAG: glycoside hydrolase family 16 protein [Burkholderiaceae bacterium]|nr:glycoside hydrolase family 16 protein [Burkholderiaceae bacterium]
MSLGLLALAAAAGLSGVFFDDFSQADAQALAADGWILRSTAGHPGVPGAVWDPAAISLPGNGLLRLSAQTDGTPAGTRQAQLCSPRKWLYGTYAARLRLADEPVAGADGDPVIQTFYAASPLAHDFDPNFSEVDWEYLANGGWGSPATRLYGLSWQTVRIEPWQAHNSAHEEAGSFAGWRTLLMQVTPDAVRLYVDGRPFATHRGRNVPVQAMAIQFNLWFSPGGLGAPTAQPRRWQQEVDWVFHAAGQQLSLAEVDAEVLRLRAAGVARQDGVAAPQPAADSPCNL